MPEMRMNSLKSRAMNCGPLSEMICGLASGCFSLAAWSVISMHDRAAEAIQHAAQIVKRAGDIDVTHVDMPVLVWLGRLLETSPFLRCFRVPFPQQSRPAQHPPYAGRTHRHDIGVQHHEGQPPVAFQRVPQMESHDRPLLPVLQPKVPGNPTVVLVGATVALSPIVEFAAGHAQPSNESPRADLAGLRPAPDEIHDLVPHIVRHPDPVQSSPSSFFNAICSAISSARTSSLRWIFFSRNSMRSCSP